MPLITFVPSATAHQQHYELAHVCILTTREPLSPADELRLGRLQEFWEEHGIRHENELVVNDLGFTAHRYTLAPSREAEVIDLDPSMFALLVRLVRTKPLAGYMVRPKIALLTFLGVAVGE